MESWTVDAVTLRHAENAAEADAGYEIACTEVLWHSANDVAGERAQQEAAPCLIVRGVDMAGARRVIEQPPAKIIFKARGYLELREFAVRGVLLREEAAEAVFYLPPTGQGTAD